MNEALKLMAVLAHPDDESLGVGGALAAYAAAGVDVSLVTATRGERGRFFTNENRPSDEEVGRVREAELRAAARVLGIRDVALLGYLDGELDRADPQEAVGRIVAHLRRVRPQVVVTFEPFGAYGHPDHVAICQLTTAAVVAAADPAYAPDHPEPHRVEKLYYFVTDRARWDAYQSAFKTLVSRVDGKDRLAIAWPDWAVTAQVDTRAQQETVWRAVQCHRSQLAIYSGLAELTAEEHTALWGSQTFYRALSLVNGGREMENDLFVGIRPVTSAPQPGSDHESTTDTRDGAASRPASGG
jgi:LmbE family N-acetylglucosaminyl deacetylase